MSDSAVQVVGRTSLTCRTTRPPLSCVVCLMTYSSVLSGPVCESLAVRTKRVLLVSSIDRLAMVFRGQRPGIASQKRSTFGAPADLRTGQRRRRNVIDIVGEQGEHRLEVAAVERGLRAVEGAGQCPPSHRDGRPEQGADGVRGEIGPRLRALRRDRGLTLEALAAATGITVARCPALSQASGARLSTCSSRSRASITSHWTSSWQRRRPATPACT